jgi:hypothetical protein
VQARDAVPTHYLAAFGPRAVEIGPLASLAQVDLDEQRRWVRQRESDLAVLQEMIELLPRHERWFTEWRRYIQELETKLGLPLSGAARDELPPGSNGA